MRAVERQVHTVGGGAAEWIGVDPGPRIPRAPRIVDEGFRETGEPHRGRGNDRALQMGIARQRQLLARGALEADACALAAECGEVGELRLEPEPRRDEDL